MANFGELVLLLGDHHIPTRATSIPDQFQRMLIPNKMQHVLCTGNIGSVDEYNRLVKLVGSSLSVHCVSGDYDFASSAAPNNNANSSSSAGTGTMPVFPETRVLQLGNFRVGMIGGHQIAPLGDLSSLGMVRRRLNVDVLVVGGKREEGVIEHEGGYYVFPGSITGAYSSSTPNVNPSFILLAIQGNKIVWSVSSIVPVRWYNALTAQTFSSALTRIIETIQLCLRAKEWKRGRLKNRVLKAMMWTCPLLCQPIPFRL